jgi:hypothetical protein
MKEEKIYWVALFDSVSYVIKAESILKKVEIPHKIIPVPKNISTDCGVCIRFTSDQKNAVMDALGSSIQDIEICELL